MTSTGDTTHPRPRDPRHHAVAQLLGAAARVLERGEVAAARTATAEALEHLDKLLGGGGR